MELRLADAVRGVDHDLPGQCRSVGADDLSHRPARYGKQDHIGVCESFANSHQRGASWPLA
jgi:hypothetical protein